jgi:hypothetical protein
MHEGEVGPVVDYIYEAAVRPELWRPALDRLASASNALGAQMLYHRPEGAALHTVSSGLKEASSHTAPALRAHSDPHIIRLKRG